MLLSRAVRLTLPTTSKAPAVSLRVCSSTKARCYSVAADAPVPKSTKVWESVDEAVKDVKSGDTLLCGGKHLSL
jgi:3-oxoacid CoA-transferase